MQMILGDLRYAVRQFRQSPGFTITAVLTLALGIGGATGVFSLIHNVMLRSLPVVDPDSLYRIGKGNDCCVEGGPQDEWGMLPNRLLERIKADSPEFEELAAFQAGEWRSSVRQSGRGPARAQRTEFVTGNYFDLFGLRPFAGRLFTKADDQPSAAPVAVVSYRLWRETFGGDPSIVGSSLIIEGHPFQVIGIAPPGFYGETLRSDPPDIWMPMQQEPLIKRISLVHSPFSAWLRAIGRLRPVATTEGMNARYTTLLRRWMVEESQYPADWMGEVKRTLPKQTLQVVPARTGVGEMQEEYGKSLTILLTACGLVLLIASANIANLLLARGVTRRAQTSIRLAVGASNGRIVRQALIESVLLALGGGSLGLLVAYGAGQLLLWLAFHTSNFVPISAAPSWPVLGFACGLSLATGMLFGTAPAWLATRTDPIEALRGSGRSTRRHDSLVRRGLLVVQATLAVVLVAGSTMMTRSLINLERQNFGFPLAQRVAVTFNPLPGTYTQGQLDAVNRRLQTRLEQIPGVQRAGLALYNPLTGNWSEEIVLPDGSTKVMGEHSGSSLDRITVGFLETLGQKIVQGRSFTIADAASKEPVAVVNQTFVKRFFPRKNPLNEHFGMDLQQLAGTFRIIGVAQDAKYTSPEDKVRPMFFALLEQRIGYSTVPLMQQLEDRTHLAAGAMLLTSLDPGRLEPHVRAAFAEVDPNLTVQRVQSLKDLVAGRFEQRRAVASLAGVFSVVALLLAAVGLYGVTAYSVAQRTSEIGVRMALGAARASVVQLVLQGAFRHVIIGLLLGIPLAIAAGRLLASQLYGVAIYDPPAMGLAVVLLALFALIATLVPASRAAAIDPLRALRVE